jgi:metallo-beta-lactamase class B/metallo-beta-lactamase class B GIM
MTAMRVLLAILALLFSAPSHAGEAVPEPEIEAIEEGVFLHRSYKEVEGFGLVSSNGLVVAHGGKAFIVDTPWTDRDTEWLVRWIAEHDYALLGSVSTHSHQDRAGGIGWLNAHSIPTYASVRTNEILEADRKEPATHAFEGPEFRLAGGLIEIFYPGAGHTADNLVVWLPQSRILFGGCLVRSLGSGGLGYTGEADIAQWPGSVDNVLERYPEARIVIPGHGGPGGIGLLTHTRKLAESAASPPTQPTGEVSAD